MPQHAALDERIALLRELAEADERLEGVLLYGSWTLGEADEHSDIEAYLYVRDEHLDTFDGEAFLGRLAPLELAYTNMFGILAVVFDDLMRGEFHLTAASTGIEEVPGWAGLVHLPRPEAAVLLDRTGRLTEAARVLAERREPEAAVTAQQRIDELTNWTLALAHILARGELARAHNLLTAMIAPQQLQLLRVLRESTTHWLTPSRALEQDLPAEDIARYAKTTAPLEEAALRDAARNSWAWTRQLAAEAARRWGCQVPERLHDKIADRLNGQS
ncbi:nucleotidyltransferase domain-containing protein [Streptomyces sp. YC504]|uniref:Nucleotidyltransferase domain-containing protein n=1 Tax=Streptomyces mesophilus TaxID=1775132 RepID=A0A6G4XDM8_9ACTN|nr:aminoglycoside 6-adenylyltransferase [Streptomyces mesophilus]NGO75498.1 nucleotidyltransferase domain-containing protein [Streptomyces mesophilus]